MTTLNTSQDLPLVGAEEAILSAIRQLKYGTVAITVHDAQVVQLETTEKVRFKK